jgi:uncharacterized coiled-coil DUF342 family protein
MGILTATQIAAAFTSLRRDIDELGERIDELRAQVEALLEGRSAGMRAAFETYGGRLDELRARVDKLEGSSKAERQARRDEADEAIAAKPAKRKRR